MKRLAIAVVGLGRWGLTYCRTLARLDDCQLVAAVDCSMTARREAARILADVAPRCRVLPDVSLLHLAAPDAAVIATPWHTHFPLARCLLTAGLDILVEKPVTASLSEALVLADLAYRYRRTVAVGHTSVYNKTFQQALRVCSPLSSGYLLARRVSTQALKPVAGRAAPAASPVQVLWDLAPHDIAMAIMLAGAPVKYRCRNRGKLAVDYHLLFAGGVFMRGFAAWGTRRLREFRVATNGVTLAVPEPVNGEVPFDELPLTRQCRDFIVACQNRRPPASDLGLGIATVKVLEGLTASLPGRWMMPDSGDGRDGVASQANATVRTGV